MGGWRARVGVLLPSVNTVLEPDFYRMAPNGVTVHVSRLARSKSLRDDLPDVYRMNQQIERAAGEVASAEVDVILYGCTGGSLLEGVGYDQEIIERIEEAAGVPATTTATAVVRALTELSIKRLVVVTPYSDDLNQREKAFLEGSGFQVLSLEGLSLSTDYGTWPAERTYSFARDVAMAVHQDFDGLFVSCTNFPAIEVIQALEEDLGVSVVTSNQASIWDCLRITKVRSGINGYGRLLQSA